MVQGTWPIRLAAKTRTGLRDCNYFPRTAVQCATTARKTNTKPGAEHELLIALETPWERVLVLVREEWKIFPS